MISLSLSCPPLRNERLIADPVRSRQISERIPAGRWGDPRDFAGPIVFLASNASTYVSGELLVGMLSFLFFLFVTASSFRLFLKYLSFRFPGLGIEFLPSSRLPSPPRVHGVPLYLMSRHALSWLAIVSKFGPVGHLQVPLIIGVHLLPRNGSGNGDPKALFHRNDAVD